MLATFIPLFDEKMGVRAYSLFTQKKNFLLDPFLLGTGRNDGANNIEGLDLIQTIGLETIPSAQEIFISITNISIFSDIASQCDVPHKRLVLLIDNTIPPVEMYISRLKELKSQGYRLALRKLPVRSYEDHREILSLMDYLLLDCEKVDVSRAKLFFSRVYPNLILCAGNIQTQERFERIKKNGGCELYEGSFYRLPVTQGENEVAPLKFNYIELMNLVNKPDFDLTTAADIIGRDTALVISLLQMVNRISINSEITSIRHAAAMLGQKELKRWINTAVVRELCADKPNEITRISLLRAKFAENLAPLFELASQSSGLFLAGLFSVLDLILEKPMREALSMVTVSKEIYEALVDNKGEYAKVLSFIRQYESADWPEVSRIMLLGDIDTDPVYDAFIEALRWYRELFSYSDKH